MKFVPLCLLAIVIGYAHAQTLQYRNEFGFRADNDGFLANGSDRYYTAGTFLFYNHALGIKPADTGRLANKTLAFELGQKIYNPQTANISGWEYIDRPFACTLYLSTSVNRFYSNQSYLNLSITVGVTGPAAFGQQVQKFIHNTLHFYAVNGWQYQIQNDAEINLKANYSHPIVLLKSWDMAATGYASLGNGFTGAGLGFAMRWGIFNPMYHSAAAMSTISRKKLPTKPYELFLYCKPMVNWVVYDATIQGSLWFKSNNPNQYTLKKNSLLLNQQVGAAWVYKHAELNASVIWQSREAPLMFLPHQWGTIGFMYRFGALR